METLERNNGIKQRFTRALSTYDDEANAQHKISRTLISVLKNTDRLCFDKVLEIGCGTGGFTRLLHQYCQIDKWTVNDLCDHCEEKIQSILSDENYQFISGDAETLDFPTKYNLIASSSAFQWMSNPELFFEKLAHLLEKDGLLLFSTFAPDNFFEIKRLTGKGLVYPTPSMLKRWFNQRFNLVYMNEDEIRLNFNSPLQVLKHLKATGVTATGNVVWTRGIQNEFCKRYTELFSTETQKVHLTYKPIYVLATKK